MAENTVNPVAEEELSGEKLNEVLRIRREKLDALVAAGKDPFKITKYDRTHHSSDIRENSATGRISREIFNAMLRVTPSARRNMPLSKSSI